MDDEIEAARILSKRVKLRSVSGRLHEGHLDVYECEVPYILIFLINGEFGEVRMDVSKDSLAVELRLWLEGKQIRYPAAFVSSRIEESINRFVKYGKTPLQEDLIMWLISRSEFWLSAAGSSDSMKTIEAKLIFGGESTEDDNHNIPPGASEDNQYAKTVNAAARNSTPFGSDSLLAHEIDDHNKDKKQAQSLSAPANNDDLGMFAMTKKLLGNSATLTKVKQSAKTIKGRDGAKAAVSTNTWSAEQKRVCADIEAARKNIEKAMDARRRIIEVSKTRQVQSADKYRTIKEKIKQEQGGNKFMKEAMTELESLIKMEADIDDDLRRQRNRAHRSAQLVAWTMAPSGFINRRGKWQKGPVLGEGPLHPNATSSLHDPRITQTMQHFYWDTAGRRHARRADDNEDEGNESLIEKAMGAIRKAAANISAYKLDLKSVFERFDTSGDGYLSPPEMAEAFLSMGVKLDTEAMVAIFKHFDPNDSGSVHFGEFVWAFFNRRDLVRKWKRTTDGMTQAQIKSKFHDADINGDGKLNPKEFKRLLKSFGMEMSDQEIEIVINRFDMDNDGDIDIFEFKNFIESEQKVMFSTTTGEPAAAGSVALPPPKGAAMAASKSGGTGARMSTAPSSSGRRGGVGPSSSSTSKPAAAAARATHSANARPQSAPRSRSSSSRAPTAASTVPLPQRPPAATWDAIGDSGSRNRSKSNNMAAASVYTVDSGVDGSTDDVDPLYLSHLHKLQAAVESRLGKHYYPTYGLASTVR